MCGKGRLRSIMKDRVAIHPKAACDLAGCGAASSLCQNQDTWVTGGSWAHIYHLVHTSLSAMPTKSDLREANRLAWERGKSGTHCHALLETQQTVSLTCWLDPSQYKNLDSNIKKNTAFIKKCKASLAADSTQQLLNDIKKLSLEKYISEVVGGVLDGMLKCKSSADAAACVEVGRRCRGNQPTSLCSSSLS